MKTTIENAKELIKAIELCAFTVPHTCEKCPYNDYPSERPYECIDEMHKDIIEFLEGWIHENEIKST